MKFQWISQCHLRCVFRICWWFCSRTVYVQMFTDAMKLLFKRDTLEAQLQRPYVEEGMYDLCIDGCKDVATIGSQQDWMRVEAGTTIVMRIIRVLEEPTNPRKYQCPRCKMWNRAPGDSPSIDWSVYLFALLAHLMEYIIKHWVRRPISNFGYVRQ